MKFISAAAFAALSLSGLHAQAAEFTISSPAIAHGFSDKQQLSSAYGFGCSGSNESPAIAWSGAPAKAKSFAVSVYDKDAPTGSGFWHWVVANIPAGVTAIPAGAGSGSVPLPQGAIQARTDFGVPGYAGPCVPPGSTHSIAVTVSALDADTIPVTETTTAAIAGYMTNAHTIAKATLMISQKR